MEACLRISTKWGRLCSISSMDLASDRRTWGSASISRQVAEVYVGAASLPRGDPHPVRVKHGPGARHLLLRIHQEVVVSANSSKEAGSSILHSHQKTTTGDRRGEVEGKENRREA